MAALRAGRKSGLQVPSNAGLNPWRQGNVLVVLALLVLGPGLTAQEHAAQPTTPPAAHAAPAAGHAPAAEDTSHAPAGEAHDESIWPQVGKIVNFAILIGTVIYFARKPLADYLANRRAQVRSDLVTAEELKKSAAAQIAEMDAKLQALPAELEALKARGQQEIAAEETRIRELAETERARLLEAASREIEQRTRVARRELVEHAASLAVGVAQTKIKAQITDADQARLVDRYLVEVKSHE
jgi:F-type H+-transporting ATPase subunit b